MRKDCSEPGRRNVFGRAGPGQQWGWTGQNRLRAGDAAPWTGFNGGNGGAEVNGILNARATRPLWEGKPGQQWTGLGYAYGRSRPSAAAGGRRAPTVPLSSKVNSRDLKIGGGCGGSGPSELRSVSFPNRPHVEGASTFVHG